MPNHRTTEALDAALRHLRRLAVIPAVGRRLGSEAADAGLELAKQVAENVDAYTSSANPDVLPSVEAHFQHLATDVAKRLAGGGQSDNEFVHHYATQTATQKFPLDAVLDGYRKIQHSLLVWIRGAALDASDKDASVRRVVAGINEFTLAYLANVASLATAEYVQRTRRIAEAEGDQRTELMTILLGGYDESDTRAAQMLRRAGYLEQRQSFCVAVARSVDPREMENDARATRMADALSTALKDLPVRTIVAVRDSMVIAIVSANRRMSGWTAPQSLLADRINPALRTVGPAALIGLSTDAPSTSHIPRALNESKLALDFATVTNRVMPYADIPFRHRLVRLAQRDIKSTLPVWLPPFQAQDAKAAGALTQTLIAYADADMNVLRTAKLLNLHPNTIYARLQKIHSVTGLNALSYHALTELLLATECDALM